MTAWEAWGAAVAALLAVQATAAAQTHTLQPAQGAAAPSASVPRPGELSAADRAAIMQAAGFMQKRGQWFGCDGATTPTIEAKDVRDINGDGQLDAIVTDSGTACYGSAEQGFVVVSRGPGGQWRKIYASQGVPEFLKTGANGWPDLEVGGPGFCFPILRWNGSTYVQYRKHEYQRGACARR